MKQHVFLIRNNLLIHGILNALLIISANMAKQSQPKKEMPDPDIGIRTGEECRVVQIEKQHFENEIWEDSIIRQTVRSVLEVSRLKLLAFQRGT